jgi:hypothetical protein
MNCPVCEGSRVIRYGDVYTLSSGEKYVSWETGTELPCGCTQLVPIVLGEAS